MPIADVAFSAMKERQPDELFAGWIGRPNAHRKEMDVEFRDIFELSCEKGLRAILDDVEWHIVTLPRGHLPS